MKNFHPLKRYRMTVLAETLQGAADLHGIRKDTWSKMERGLRRIPEGLLKEITDRLPDGPNDILFPDLNRAALEQAEK